ncbi:MAG: flagellar motor protein MotB [Myxococcales bacterium]|nr:flagellar motor protein MotB [Myxococcales bacterium]
MAENEAEEQDGEEEAPGSSAEQEDESPPCEEGAPGWVVTFGDMMSLLLTFFILLLSFATMETVKYKVLSGSIQVAFGVQEITPTWTRPQARKIIAREFSMQFNSRNMLDGMKKIEERETARTPSGRVDIKVFEDYRGIVVSIGANHLFEAGKADLKIDKWPFLDDIVERAATNQAQIQVEAHTDSIPIKTAEFPSNDHLSAARAVSVIRYFRGVRPDLPAHRFEAVPAGQSRPKYPNFTDSGRKKNRRIELIFHRPPKMYQYKPKELAPSPPTK